MRRRSARNRSAAPAAAARNPRNIPHPGLDASPPQPDVPEPSAIEDQQDQQPVEPAPLVHEAPNPSRGTREEKNG